MGRRIGNALGRGAANHPTLLCQDAKRQLAKRGKAAVSVASTLAAKESTPRSAAAIGRLRGTPNMSIPMNWQSGYGMTGTQNAAETGGRVPLEWGMKDPEGKVEE
jgi:hypothetical protein